MNGFKRKSLLAFLLLALAPLFTALIPAPPAYAADAIWLDAAHIKIGNDVYIDGILADSTRYYWLNGGEGCTNFIGRFEGSPNPSSKATLFLRHSKPEHTSECVEDGNRPLEMGEVARASVYFYRTSDDTLTPAFQSYDIDKRGLDYGEHAKINSEIFQNSPAEPNIYGQKNSGTCHSTVQTAPNSETGRFTPRFDQGTKVTGCISNDTRTVLISNTPPDTSVHLTPPGGSSDTTCNIPYISWIVCPLITVGYGVIHFLESKVAELLQTPDLTPVEPIWAAFRNLANVLFVLLFLIIIFSNMLSIHLDAYTVKKLLPKLVMAAILVQFSFIFTRAAIDISNVVGVGISNLPGVTSVGKQQSNAGYETVGIAEGIISVGGGTAAAVIGVINAPEIAIGVIITVLLLIISGISAVFVVLLTLTVRLIAIELFVVLAPVAFALWVLPNTEKYFKDWLENFIKLLLMYPLIRLLFAAGELVNQVSNTSPGNFTTHLVGTIAPIAVFFMIPATFKIAAKALSLVGGTHIGKAGSFGSNLRKGQLAQNVKAGVKEGAAVKLLATKQTGLKGLAAKGFGRVVTGNALSFGTTGKRKISSTIDAAKAAQASDANKQLVEAGIGGNNALLEDLFKTHEMKDDSGIKITDASGSTIMETAEEYAKRKGIKITDAVKAAAIQRMANQGGTKELLRIHKDLGLDDPSSQNYSENKVLWDRALEGKTGDLAKKAPHTVRADRFKAYQKINGAAAANLDGDVSETYFRNAVYETDPTGEMIQLDSSGNEIINSKGAETFVNAALQISQSSTLRSTANTNLKKTYQAARTHSSHLAGATATLQGVQMTGQDFAETFINQDGTIRETESLDQAAVKTMVNQVRQANGRPLLP